jgi:ABC-type transport system involved in multi-copper enzyme maturation permease subunit
MIGKILAKELLEHLLSLRFQAGFVLALVLVSVSAFALSSSYERRQEEVAERHRLENELLATYGHFNRFKTVVQAMRPPSPAVVIRNVPTGIETLDSDPMVELFPPMDLTAVVAVILSLLGVVLGFDSINGEKERGTLRLMLANRVRRTDVLFAKWVAGLVLLAFVLVTALLAAAVIVLLRARVEWTAADWVAGGMNGILAFLYCSVFFTLAVSLSAVIRRSGVSVLAALLAWAVFVSVVPNISPYLAAQVVRIPSIAALERDVQYVTSEERDVIGEAAARAVWERYPMLHGLSSAERERRSKVDPEFRDYWMRYSAEWDGAWAETNRKQEEKARQMREARDAIANRQFALSRIISHASPLPPLVYGATALADTGFSSVESFKRQSAAYREVLDEYSRARLAEEQRNGRSVGYNDFLDLATRPRFQYQPAPLSARLEGALPSAGILAGWILGLLLLGVIGIQRFDVR